MDEKTGSPVYWIPLAWAGSIITSARRENRILSDYTSLKLMEKLDQFRTYGAGMLIYDWINVPLVYTQVRVLCVCVLSKIIVSLK